MKLRASFRARLLLSMVGLVAVLLGLLLVMLQLETQRRIDAAVSAAAERSRRAFSEFEQLRRHELERFSLRFVGTSRMPSALEAAREDDDPEVLVEAARYELTLAGLDRVLVVFAEPDGAPVVALVGGETVPWSRPLPAAAGLAVADSSGLGYDEVGGRLFAVTTVPLEFFGRLVGSVVLGFPVDREAAQRLADGIGAEVCFVAPGGTVVATEGVDAAGLRGRMTALAELAAGGALTRVEGHWALVAEPLVPDQPEVGQRAIAVPLDGVVAPYERLRARLWLAGLAVLALAAAVGTVLARGLAAPVKELEEATGRVAGGDLGHRVEVRRQDELGRLAAAFNRMIQDLELKERYRSLLDRVVSREVAEEMLRTGVVLGGESRRVTVLFADVRGFSALAEGMEPQAVIAMLNEFMDRAAAAIEGEAGVVDKYVGDAIMAVFGAPLAHPDDPLRAVRAGLGIQGAVAELNRERVARGEPPLEVGVGVSTGVAVAGNMGSHRRLNYTVLGTSVNLAARLCAIARGGQVLVSEETVRELGDRVEAEPLEKIVVKGFSVPVQAFAVRDRGGSAPTGQGAMAVLALAALLAGVVPVAADGPPTLSGLGAHWASADGRFQLGLSGRLLLEAYLTDDEPAWLVEETDPFATGELSLFVDATLGRHLVAVAELRLDSGADPSAGHLEGRVEQAFLRWSTRRGEVAAEVGRFVTPFGAYPQRHDTVADPFIRPPLPYDWRTMVCAGIVPYFNDGFISWKDRPDEFRPAGAPPVWGALYHVGVMALGGAGPFSYRLAAMGSALSSAPEDWNYLPGDHSDPTWVGHLGWRVSPGLELGVSHGRGPYLESDVAPDLPGGGTIDDYEQILWGVDLAFTRGWTEVRAEVLDDTWEVPNVVDDPRDLSWFVELKQKLAPGWFAAARWGRIRFNRIARSDGGREVWDWDVQRWQVALGYRILRTLEVRGEILANRSDGPRDPDDDLVSLQVRWEF